MPKHECVLYRKTENELLQCTACSHYCTIAPGRTGICGVRQNHEGKLYLTVHSQPCAVHVDPIEKKPLYHFLPGTCAFSLGTIGCNFKCDFCQNWQISQDRPKIDLEDQLGERGQMSPQQVVEQCKQHNCQSIAFTYNEPTIWAEYALDICQIARQNKIKTVFVSNGFMSPETRAMLVGQIDAINIDLKAFSDQTYQKVMGGRLQPVLDNIKFFYENGVETEITTLIVPEMNDSDEEITNCAKFLSSIGKDIPWHLSAFHPDFKMTNVERTPLTTLLRAFEIAKSFGLENVYVGNLQNDHESTVCECGNVLIKRKSYSTEVRGMDQGLCYKCGKRPYGVFA